MWHDLETIDGTTQCPPMIFIVLLEIRAGDHAEEAGTARIFKKGLLD